MKYISLLSAFFFLLLLNACGPANTVRLLPPPAIQASSLPAPNAPSISVVVFSDKRVDPEIIGKRRDGSAFTTSEDVALWISKTLADELARKGMRITFASSTAEATRGTPDYLVTGSVEQFWLTEASAVEISANISVKCTLANRKGRIWSETTNSSQTHGGLLSGRSADNLLMTTLQDLTQPLVQKIVSTIQAKK